MIEIPAYILEYTRDFTGREWVFSEIDRWLQNTSERAFLLTGDPGTGKSAIAARLAQMSLGQGTPEGYARLGKGVLSFFHFCKAFNEESLNPQIFAKLLSDELCSRVPGFAQAVTDSSDPHISIRIEQQVSEPQAGANVNAIGNLNVGTLSARATFEQYVRKPLNAVYNAGFAEPVVLLIDSLDEADTYGEQNIAWLLAQFIDDPDDLPRQVRFILTSRRVPPELSRLVKPSLDLISDAPADLREVHDFVFRRLQSLEEPGRTALASRVADQSKRNFLYAHYIIDDLLERNDLPEDLGELTLPEGLTEVYQGFMRRELDGQRKDYFQMLLGLLAVARGPGISRDLLVDVSKLKASEVQEALKKWDGYLSGSPPAGPFTIFHQSFRDFLVRDQEFGVFIAEAEHNLAIYFLDNYGGKWTGCDDAYAIMYTPAHLVAAIRGMVRPGQRSERLQLRNRLRRLLKDQKFLKKKSHLAGILAVQLDMVEASAIDRAGRNYAFINSAEFIDSELKEADERLELSEILDSHTPPLVNKPAFELLGEQWNSRVGATTDKVSLISNGQFLIARKALVTADPKEAITAFQELLPQRQYWEVERDDPEYLRRYQSHIGNRNAWMEIRAELRPENKTCLMLYTASLPEVSQKLILKIWGSRRFVLWTQSYLVHYLFSLAGSRLFPELLSSLSARVGVTDDEFATLVQRLTGSPLEVSRAATLRRRYKWQAVSTCLICVVVDVVVLYAVYKSASLPFITDELLPVAEGTADVLLVASGLLALWRIGSLWLVAWRNPLLPHRWAPGVLTLSRYFIIMLILFLVLFPCTPWVVGLFAIFAGR